MKQTVDLTVSPTQSLAANFVTPGISIAPYQTFSFQVIFDWSGGATSTGSLVVEQSNDKVNWSVSPTSVQAISNTVNNLIYNLPNISARYARLSYTFTTGLGGSCQVIAHATI